MVIAADRRIAVLGAGAWGTALANLAARANSDAIVSLWARDAAHVAEMAATGVNARHLPGIPLLSNVHPTAELVEALEADVIFAVVPAQTLRQVLETAAPLIAKGAPVIVCAKGIEHATGLFLSEVVAQILPENPPAILSGPSFALDVAQGLPTAVTLAAQDGDLAARLSSLLATPWFRLYSSTDLRGVEIGGAAKNVLAIANGIAAGRGLGASAGAALVARGFAELSRFGRAFGAEPGTLMGLSGLGDLVLTCTSPMSRNYSLGVSLGRGLGVAEAAQRGGLAEGAQTCGILVDLARAKDVDMPIAAAVDAVLAERITIDEAIAALLARPSKAESGDLS
ncbi:NAD(P)H-dependent glycerol-3-phosphate dehydrogenase [Methylocapsa acidiphila]|uniref:NAD(P)H-dependent glycerol-3-phosphate dehydrogenase n=1 Tax=Methylocapsa acidiphila TaxID=133552 RepID=UPI00041D6604|nr:NAD(P)H-dependent glycerol-3-phosphate dehydrogenase [Methylocapsa acidiphila]